MTVETELKLHIAPEHLQKLKRHPFLRPFSRGRAKTQRLYSIYYDTPKLELRQHAMALRLRLIGTQWIQTLKGGGEVSAGLHQRNEWETPVPSEQLDLVALKACGGEFPRGVRGRLQPVFVTDFSRNVRLLDFEGAVIELGMDSGEIRAGQSSCPISELELELKSGAPQQLFKLALALLDIVPLQVEHTSKAEYGYRLFSAEKTPACKGRFPPLKRSQSIDSALRGMIAACLAHVQSNVPGALLKLDEEYLHQVRVGLRRLRVVLAIAQRHRADAGLDALREEVTKLCVELGRARDWDVFVTQVMAPVCARLPEHAGLREVLSAAEKARRRQHAGMETRLASQDFQRLLLHFGAWLHSVPATREEAALARFAAQTLERRGRRVLKLGRSLAAEDVAQLHALRIACKKLRYSIEVFGSLFDEKADDYASALAELQDVMGRLNDIAVAHRLLSELETPARHDALELVRGWMAHDYVARAAEFVRAWKRFAGKRAFWG